MQALARNGYTASEVRAALTAARRELSFRYDLLDADNIIKRANLDNVLMGSVANNSLADIKRTARFTLRDDASIDYLSDRIRPWARLHDLPTLVSRVTDTQAEWALGTLTNVVANANGLELAGLSDDFSDPTASGTLWTVTAQGGSGTQAYTGGESVLTPEQDVTNSVSMRTNGSYTRVKVRAKLASDGTNSTKYLNVCIGAGSIVDAANGETTAWHHTVLASGYSLGLQTEGSATGLLLRRNDGAGVSQVIIGFVQAPANWTTTYHDYEVEIHSGGVRFLVDDVVVGDFADMAFASGDILISQGEHGPSGNGAILHVDSVEGTFVPSGTRISPPLDLTPVGIAASSSIAWTATTPTGTAVAVETSLDAGMSYQTPVNGGSIPGISEGGDMTGVSLLTRVTETTTDPDVTPTVHSLRVRVVSADRHTGAVEWPQGVFLLSTPARHIDEAGVVTREVEAYDQLVILRDDKVTDRYTVASGSNYIDEVATLLTGAGIDAQNLTPTANTLPTARDWPPGTSKLRIVNDLLGAINYRSLFFDAIGTAVAESYVSPADQAPEFAYRDDAESVIFPEAEDKLDLFDIPNQWVLVRSEPDLPPLSSTFTNDNAASPTSTVSRGRTIVDFRDSVEAADQAALDAKAERLAFEASQVFQQVEMETGLMPFHGDADVLELAFSGLGISAKFSESQWGMELRAGGRMSHTLRRVVNVNA